MAPCINKKTYTTYVYGDMNGTDTSPKAFYAAIQRQPLFGWDFGTGSSQVIYVEETEGTAEDAKDRQFSPAYQALLKEWETAKKKKACMDKLIR